MFKAEPGLIIWTLVSFFILLILLAKLVYPLILKGLKKREETIQQQLEEARKTKQEAAALLEDYKRQLAEARSEAQKIINEGKGLGENMRKEIVQKAQQESNQIVKRAQEEIELQKQKALLELQEKIADLSIMAASKVINKSLNTEDHRRLVEEYVSKVGELYGK
ncbi:MAG: F0F1 ATP synthase subunit B [Thermodesulfobacteriota bacterium]|nr:F0F1 ATP synthase subunit B [Deltaproteobacteria bacterium]MDI6762950.1 F0F1 ATP synthase subunit B [Thermodesulfobacteriota bacterium]